MNAIIHSAGTAPGGQGVPMCAAVSQHGTVLTVYAHGLAAEIMAGPGRDFICTQDQHHRGVHTSCDGRGHVLASWGRRKTERYWHPSGCNGCAHHREARTGGRERS